MPGDHLRAPGPRLRVVAPESSAPVARIPDPPQPWAQDARDVAARLHVVPAFKARVPVRPPASVPAAPPCPTERGLHRPGVTPGGWVMLVLALAVLCAAFAFGGTR